VFFCLFVVMFGVFCRLRTYILLQWYEGLVRSLTLMCEGVLHVDTCNTPSHTLTHCRSHAGTNTCAHLHTHTQTHIRARTHNFHSCVSTRPSLPQPCRLERMRTLTTAHTNSHTHTNFHSCVSTRPSLPRPRPRLWEARRRFTL
jgi:hypothetical protein